MKSKHVKVIVRTRPTSDFADDILQISQETNVGNSIILKHYLKNNNIYYIS